MIKNHGSTFLKAFLKDKDSIKRSLQTNVDKKQNINLNSLGFIGKNLEEKLIFTFRPLKKYIFKKYGGACSFFMYDVEDQCKIKVPITSLYNVFCDFSNRRFYY